MAADDAGRPLSRRSPGDRGGEWTSAAFWTVFALTAWAAVQLFVRNGFVVQDDAYVYLRVVRNVLAGQGPVFNAGDAHLAVTSPLWTYVLALAGWLAPGADLAQAARLLSIGLLLGASVFAALLVRPRLGAWAGLAPLALFLTPILHRALGNEVPLAYFGAFGAFWAAIERRHPALLGLFLATAYLARGENVFLVPLLGAHVAIAAGGGREELRRSARYLLLAGGTALALALAWHVSYALRFGSVFPETLRAKVLQGRSGRLDLYVDYLGHHAAIGVRHALLGGALAAVGVVRLLPRCAAVFLWPLLNHAVYALLGVAYYHWYYYALEVVLSLALLCGAVEVARGLGAGLGGLLARWRLPRARSAAEVALPVVLLLPLLPAYVRSTRVHWGSWGDLLLATRTQWSSPTGAPDFQDPRLQVYGEAAAWLSEHHVDSEHPADRRIVTAEVGILGYCLPEFELADVVGLASPIRAPEDVFDWGLHLERWQPRYVFDPWSKEPALRHYLPPDGPPQTYRRIHVTRHRGAYRGVWLERSEEPRFATLEALRAGASEGSIVRWIPRGDYAVLLVLPPCELALPLPVGTRGLDLVCGMTERSWTMPDEKLSDGAVFTVHAIDTGGARREVWRRALDPVGNTPDRDPQGARIELPEGDWSELRFAIEPGGHGLADFTYWSRADLLPRDG